MATLKYSQDSGPCLGRAAVFGRAVDASTKPFQGEIFQLQPARRLRYYFSIAEVSSLHATKVRQSLFNSRCVVAVYESGVLAGCDVHCELDGGMDE